MEHLHRYAIARDLAYGKDVLDIACGEGYGSELLATVARKVTGVDISEEAIAHAARKYVRPNIAFAVGSCACIPLADASVDLVVSFETIEHHDRHLEMMQEIRRVLRPTGALIISSPDKHEYSDVPDYKNEYHVKELYLSEFKDLLATGFKHVRVLGQRVNFGSLVAPTDGRATRFATYSSRNASVRREPGVMKPVYYIALASNAALPQIHGGLYDGTSYLSSQLAGRDGQIASLTQAVAERDGRIASLNAAVVERDGRIDRLNQGVAQRDWRAASLNNVVAERDRTIDRLNQAVAERDGSIASLNNSVAERDGQLDRLSQMVAGRDRRIANLNQAVAKRDVMLHAMRSSTSWRLTAPLRFVKSAASSLHPLRRLRRAVSIAATSLYRALPLSAGRKVKLKGWLFSALPFLFRHSAAYRNWLVSAGQQPAPVHVVSDKTRTAPLAHPETEIAHETCPASVSKYLDDLFVGYQSNPGGSVTYVPRAAGTLDADRLDVKLIAFYLPQYHPIPENDRWWGKGFTEWTNVSKAVPQFVGHYQPRLPGELGFYDLRVPDVQRRQIELAKTYGIYGFCYHHYWFAGKRLLETPFNQVLASPELDLPFCLCWANENWTRRWDGFDQDVLLAQAYSEEDDLAFIKDIDPALRDPRYIRVDGRPLLIVYRVSQLPDARATAKRWRKYCEQTGIGDLFLVAARSFHITDPRPYGFDAAVQFPPHQVSVPKINNEMAIVNPAYSGNIFDYRQIARAYAEMEVDSYLMFRCVMPGWDNEARQPGRGHIFAHSSPEAYAEWLDQACLAATSTPRSQRLVFVNAWNEWGEGAYLEPDRTYGYAYLHATRDVLARYPARRSRKIVYVSHDALYMGAQLLSLHIVKGLCEQLGFQVDVILLAGGPLAPDFARYARVHDFSVPGCTPERQAQVIRELFDSGARAAITSTTVSGALVVPLKRQGFRVVSLVHELPGLIRERKLEGLLENIARFADRVVFPTRGVSEKVCDLSPISPEKVIIRPQGLLHRNMYRDRTDEARKLVRTEFGLPEKARIVMAMGYGDHRKGVDLFVEAALVTIEKRPDVYFVWVGNCDPEQLGPLGHKIAERNAADRILFPGFRPCVDVYLSGADVFLLSSREDPFPSVVLEAMHAGLPVIGFEDVGGFCDLLNEGGGLMVPYEDIAAAARAIQRLLDNDVLWQRVSTRAGAIVGDRFQFPDYLYDLACYAVEHCPKVSVILPNYNYERYLSQRLLSVLWQTYRPYEVLFLDDCSTDGSVGVAERILGSFDLPFRIIRNATNQGTFKQWIRGIREASGDLVWIAEADDFCEEGFLEVLVEAFRDPEVALAYSQSRQIDETGRVLAENYLDYTRDISETKWLRPYVRSGIDEIRDTLAIKNSIPNSSAVVMRKPAPQALESAVRELRIAGDWLTYVEVLAHGKVAYFPDALNSHRRHQRGATLASDNIRHLKEILAAQTTIAARFAVDKPVTELAGAYAQSIYEHFRLHERGPTIFRDHPDLMPHALALGTIVDKDLSLDNWFQLLVKSYTTPGISYKGRILPAFPDDQTQANTLGNSGQACLVDAKAFYELCESRFKASPLWKKDQKHLLDFGCGWGRIARFFYRDFMPENILGVDVNDDLLAICRETFKGPTFLLTTAFPPTSLPSGSVDFIVSYSVFSHLNERASGDWIDEFSRLLAPGGMVAITTRGRPFFQYCRSLINKGDAGYTDSLSRLFPDFDRAISDYDSGRFVHSNIDGVTGGGVLTGEFYGETFIPEKYARESLCHDLEFLEYHFEPSPSIQPTLFFRKRQQD